MIQHFWIYGFNKRKKPDFKFGTSVQIHTRTYIENFASYKTAADADRPKTRLAQARNCSGCLQLSVMPGLWSWQGPWPLPHQIALDKLVEHVVLLCVHLSRSTAGDIAELPQSADACISRSTIAGVAELPQFAHTCAVTHPCSFIYCIE